MSQVLRMGSGSMAARSEIERTSAMLSAESFRDYGPRPTRAAHSRVFAWSPAMSGPLLLTMGDACGIGPEIVARAFVRGAAAGCVVVGDVGRDAARDRSRSTQAWPLAVLDGPASDRPARRVACRCGSRRPARWTCRRCRWGRVDAAPARRRRRASRPRCGAVQAGDARRASSPRRSTRKRWPPPACRYPGHTEMLQALAGGARRCA